MGRSATVILNPTAGGGHGDRVANAIRRGLAVRGVEAVLLQTSQPLEATELASEAAASGVDLVVAAGGDGTVHEVASGLLRVVAAHGADPTATAPALGVLPVGTGNDFAKLIGPSRRLNACMDILAGGAVRRFDAGIAEWGDGRRWFVNAGGTGIDVEVVRHILRGRGRHTPGVLKYLGAVLKALVRYRAVALRITMDGHVVETDVMMVAAGNGRCVGGGFWVCPDAEPSDGRFDICIVKRTSYLESLRALPMIIRGTHAKHPKVEMHRASTVEIEALGHDPLFFQLDGELHEPAHARKLVFRIVPAALPVVTGPAQP